MDLNLVGQRGAQCLRFVYVDDVLILSHNTIAIVESLRQQYCLKEESVGKPKSYLGAEIKEFRDPNNPSAPMWSMSADKYLKEAIRNVEFDLGKRDLKLPTKVSTPFSHKYHPKMDTSTFLDDDHVRWYQQLIGILRWSIKLGRIDIHLCVALLAQYLAQPRRGHLMQVMPVTLLHSVPTRESLSSVIRHRFSGFQNDRIPLNLLLLVWILLQLRLQLN